MLWSLLSISLAAERCYPSGVDTEAYCDQLHVPLNWSDPQSTALTLNTIIVPAVRANPEPDPVVVLVGGPGQGAADTIAQLLPLLMRVQQHRSIVFMDQRGTGPTSPLRCSLTEDDFDDPAVILPELKSCGQELVESGVDPKYFVTSALVKDTEALRKKLGVEQLNLYGISYGSRLALAYMQAYPERVRAAILDGIAPSNVPLGSDFGHNAQRALENLIHDCTTDSECSKQFPELKSTLNTVWKTLQEPLKLNLPNSHTYQWSERKLDQNTLQSSLNIMLYDSELSALIPYVLNAAQHGDWQPLLVHTEHNIADTVSWEMYLSVVCSEDEHQLPDTDLSSDEAEDSEQNTANPSDYVPQVFGKKVSEDLKQMCSVWPHQDVPIVSYTTMATPTLLMSGTLDPATPPENTESLKPLLSAHTEVIFSGTGHNTLRTQCALSLFEDFLKQPSTALDVQCASTLKRPAFLLSPSGTAP